MPQNHDQQEEEDNEKEEEDGNKAEGEEDEDYIPWSNVEKDEIFHDADEIKTFGEEAPIPTGGLRDLLKHINITHLKTARQEIQKLRDQVRDSDVTIRAYQRMVAGEASDLYASDTCTWSATSSGPRAKNEPAVYSHSPSDSRTR
jgi:hypothetical protein